MNWTPLTDKKQLEQVISESMLGPVMIFKHSTRCSISAVSLNRLERNWKEDETGEMSAYFLDLIRFREISDAVTDILDKTHQSPQVLIIRDGVCVHEASHFGIDYDAICEIALNAA